MVAKPGFQGSERSGCEVTLYTKRDDPVMPQVRRTIPFTGQSARDDNPTLVSVETTHTMGQCEHSFQVIAKAPESGKYPPLDQLIVDDDWIDITFTRHGKKWHNMRGMVDEIRRVDSVSGSGTSVVTYKITGRSWSKVFAITPVWFNRFRAENLGGAAGIRVFSNQNYLGNVANVVRGILLGFLQELNGVGRGNFEPPPGVPNSAGGGIVDYITLDTTGYSDDPARFAVNASLMDPQGANIWALAKEWSDPMFCELFVDLFNERQTPIINANELSPLDSCLGVVLRDIPFPTVEKGKDSPWFTLPMVEVNPQDVVESDIGRSGYERFNAFFVGPQVNAELGVGALLDITEPLWDAEDWKLHGMRRLDINTHYSSTQADLLTMTKKQRERVRDWHVLNPYFYNGALKLGRGFPEIRVGMRVRVLGSAGPDADMTYYVESVNQSWRPIGGLKTSLGVTRGWRGTDDSLMNALNYMAQVRYPVQITKSALGDWEGGGNLV